jgi:hypothetical protein
MVDAHKGPSGPHTNRAVHAGCSACAHPWTAHDPIAARFCHVTTTARYQRGCVCTTAYREPDQEHQPRP